MENLKDIGLVKLNETNMEETSGGVKIGVGIQFGLDLENPFGLSGILESILGNVDIGAGVGDEG